MEDGNNTLHDKFGIRPIKGSVTLHFIFGGDYDLNELVHWCDESMSLIRKYGAVSARPKPPDRN